MNHHNSGFQLYFLRTVIIFKHILILDRWFENLLCSSVILNRESNITTLLSNLSPQSLETYFTLLICIYFKIIHQLFSIKTNSQQSTALVVLKNMLADVIGYIIWTVSISMF